MLCDSCLVINYYFALKLQRITVNTFKGKWMDATSLLNKMNLKRLSEFLFYFILFFYRVNKCIRFESVLWNPVHLRNNGSLCLFSVTTTSWTLRTSFERACRYFFLLISYQQEVFAKLRLKQLYNISDIYIQSTILSSYIILESFWTKKTKKGHLMVTRANWLPNKHYLLPPGSDGKLLNSCADLKGLNVINF